MRIYIESTIPSYVIARPARDLLQAARQQLTRDWWDVKREQHELFTSQVVLDEIAGGEAAMAKQRLALMGGIAVARATDEAEALTQSILDSGVLPANADRDAAHIALATVHEWNTFELELPAHSQCIHSSQTAKVGGCCRFHASGDMHAGRTTGKRK
jgi:hypothetical protein